MSDKKGRRAMTLADFLKVFEFERFNLEINYFNSPDVTIYFSKAEIERDYCAAVYTVLLVRPVDESTIRVVIWQ